MAQENCVVQIAISKLKPAPLFPEGLDECLPGASAAHNQELVSLGENCRGIRAGHESSILPDPDHVADLAPPHSRGRRAMTVAYIPMLQNSRVVEV